MNDAMTTMTEAMDEIMSITMKKLGPEVIQNMDADDLKLIQLSMEMVAAAREVMGEEYKMLKDINMKMDILLASK